jgi:hypothetical protein
VPDELKPSHVVFESPEDIPGYKPLPERGKLTRFKAGNQISRGVGRPKGPDRISEALKKELASGAASKIARQLAKVAMNESGKYTNAQVAAAKEIADRTEGRAVQPMIIAEVMDEATADRLLRLAEILTGNKDA